MVDIATDTNVLDEEKKLFIPQKYDTNTQRMASALQKRTDIDTLDNGHVGANN